MRNKLLLSEILNKRFHNDRSVINVYIFCIDLLPLEQLYRRYFRFSIRQSCPFKLDARVVRIFIFQK